jgi:PAS domain S-box-containing protein
MNDPKQRNEPAVDRGVRASGLQLRDETKRILYELQVHQAELEAQNEYLRQIQEELDTARARYFDLYELAPVGYFTLNEAGVIEEANRTATELLQVPKSGLVGLPLAHFIFEEDRHRYYLNKKHLIETGGRQVAQLRMTPRSGGPIWVRVEETTVMDATGTRVDRVIVSDITAQKHAEEILAASEAHHRLLFQKSRDGLMTIAPPLGRFTSGNLTAISMFGARDERQFVTLGLAQSSPVHQPDGSLSADGVAAMIEAALRDGSTYAEWTFKRLSGEEFLASVVLTRIEIHGEPLLQATVRDETQTKKLQASVSQQDRLANMGLLAAGVAHEINNPLASVLFNLETLTQELPGLAAAVEPGCLSDLVERAREALVGAQRINTISRAIGTFARVEGTERSRVDVNHAIQCATTMAFNDIRFRAKLVLELGELPSVWASEGKLSQVFLNLLINAAQAIGDGSLERNQIRIRTWTEGENVWAEVEDTGAGIPSEKLGRIFEPFFTTKPIGTGSGLGLSICRDIVTEFGGDIGVRSELGKGTRFLVRLPVRRGMSVPAPAAAALQLPLQPARRGRVLVVDDEPTIVSIITRMLDKKHEVVSALSADAGRAILEKDNRFDVVLCDLMMPGMTGMELHEWLLQKDPELAARVIFLTGGAFTPNAAEYIEHVTNPTLEKPFDSTKLGEAVSAAMSRASGERDDDFFDSVVGHRGHDGM